MVRNMKLRTRLNVTWISLISVFLVSCSASEPDNQTANLNDVAIEKSTSPETTNLSNGSYISQQSYESATDLYKDSQVVLFFNASWCSTCKVARDNFEASLDQIPVDVTIVVVDFDNSVDLRKKYGVTLQHTFVQIDSNGDALKKWSGSTTISELIKQTI